METFNVAEQLDKKIEDTELSSMKRSDVESIVNQIKRAIYQNHTFAYLSSVDWLTKGQITYAAMDNYKYIDKKIYSRLDIEYMRHDQQKYKELIGKYNSAPSVMSLLKAKDGKLYFEDKDFEKAFRKNFSRMRNKCVKQSQKADGVPTGLQRAAIMQSWIGMMVMIHRQFLPFMMQERWGSRVYDYDTQEYKNGLFKTWLAFIGELAINSWWCGAAGVALSTLALTTNPWVIAGVAATVSTVARGYGKMTNIQTKSLK